MDLNTKTIAINDSYDVVMARQCAREMSRDMGFSLTDQTRIATAVSEVARRALRNQGRGNVLFTVVSSNSDRGLQCTCVGGEWLSAPPDPAFGDILGGIERLVDEYEVEPRGNNRVAVIMRKWLR